MSNYIIDPKAVALLNSFIKEKLGGDIHKLKTYDFSTLENDRKYGSTNHNEAPIVIAVMVVAFGDIWPDLNMYHIAHGPYKCSTIQTFQNLFGFNMCDQYFKGMQKFSPSASQFQRALKVAHLTYSLGNFWVMPGNGVISNRILDNSYRYYMDKFLKGIYAVLIGQKRVDKTLQKAIDSSPEMKPYYGEEGFQKFVHDMMLEDYVDYYGKPIDVFDFIWSSMKDLDRETYFRAVDNYCSFCEKAFTKRADKIIEKLKIALAEQPTAPVEDIHIAVKDSPKPERVSHDEEPNAINRYGLAYSLMNMCIDTVKKDWEKRLPLMAEERYFQEICKSMGLEPDGFKWDDFYISVEKFEDLTCIFYGFPEPQKEPEAKYGALMINAESKSLLYYTLEMCSHPGRWALGRNSLDQHALMGMYDMEPTKENFLKLIVPKDKLLPEIDIKALLDLPDEYKSMGKTSAAPMYCENYTMNTSNSEIYIQAFPISARSTMDYYNVRKIIDGIHQSLGENQALIEVRAGKTRHNRQYVYSVVKTKGEPSGVQYYMLMHIAYESIAISVNGHFIETGMTGERDTFIWEMSCRAGIVSFEDKSKWMFDPYDKFSKRPYLMNLSEKEDYDKFFPNHPLTQCRKFIKLITSNL